MSNDKLAGVLGPWRTWRLRISTKTEQTFAGLLAAGGKATKGQDEFAFFRTAGPPGLASYTQPFPKAGGPTEGTKSILGDLGPYIVRTTPSKSAGAANVAPIYRGCDVCVDLEDKRVLDMYTLVRRDLTLQVIDSQGQIVPDATGQRRTVCDTVDGDPVPDTAAPLPPLRLRLRGAKLQPESSYMLRLVPDLLRERFDGMGPGYWQHPAGSSIPGWGAMPSSFKLPVQWGMRGGAGDPVDWLAGDSHGLSTELIADATPGLSGDQGHALLFRGYAQEGGPGGPSTWTDYRVSAQVEAGKAAGGVLGDAPEIGLVFRYLDKASDGHARYYSFSIGSPEGWRLVRISGTAADQAVLAWRAAGRRVNVPYRLAIEVVGKAIRAFVDDVLVFDVTDAGPNACAQGTVGLYSWATSHARFADIRVEDLRPGPAPPPTDQPAGDAKEPASAPVLWSVGFRTGRFVDVTHQLNTHGGRAWNILNQSGVVLGKRFAKAVFLNKSMDLLAPPNQLEDREFSFAVQDVQQQEKAAPLGAPPTGAETWWMRDASGAAIGLLVRLQDSVDWRRSSFYLAQAPQSGLGAVPPMGIKFLQTGIAESGAPGLVGLALDARNLEGYSVEYGPFPDPAHARPAKVPLHIERSDGAPSGVLVSGSLGPDALDRFELVSAAQDSKAALVWTQDGDAIRCDGPPKGASGPAVPAQNIEPTQPGAAASEPFGAQFGPDGIGTTQDDMFGGGVALRRGVAAADVLVRLEVEPGSAGRCGLVVRARDARQCVRLSISGNTFRIEEVAAKPTVGGKSGAQGSQTTLRAKATVAAAPGSRIIEVRIAGTQLAAWLDNRLVATVTVATQGNRFGLYSSAGAGARFLTFHAETAASRILVRPMGPFGPGVAGTFSTGPNNDRILDATEITDGEVSATVALKIGVSHTMFARYRSAEQYYRAEVKLDDALQLAATIQRVDSAGTTVVADWQAIPWNSKSAHIAFYSVGRLLEVYADGMNLCFGVDAAPTWTSGKAGVASVEAGVNDLAVIDLGRQVGKWTIADEGVANFPSRWELAGGMLAEGSGIFSPALKGSKSGVVDYRGSMAMTGDLSWLDYRVDVRVGSYDAGVGGVAFRVQDRLNYYRALVDFQSGSWSFATCVNGVLTELAPGITVSPKSPFFDLRVVVALDTLRLWCNDELVLDVQDETWSSGGVGLCSWRNRGAWFDRIAVSLPSSVDGAIASIAPNSGEWMSWPGASAVASWIGQDDALKKVAGGKADRQLRTVDTGQEICVSAVVSEIAGGAVGVLALHQDDGSHVRLTLEATPGVEMSTLRVVEVAGSLEKQRWSAQIPAQVTAGGAAAHTVTMLLRGGILSGYVDSIPVCAVPLTAPAVTPPLLAGVFAQQKATAKFRQVRLLRAGDVYGAPLLADRFDLLVPGRWTFAGPTAGGGSGDASTGWELADGALAWNAGAAPSEWATATCGRDSWKDYRVVVTADLSATDLVGLGVRRSPDGNAALEIRRSENGNTATWQLVTRSGGVETCWEQFPTTALASADQPKSGAQTLVAECFRDRIRFYVNGSKVFDRILPMPASGRVSLMSRSAGTGFRSILIQPPTWTLWHRWTGRQDVVPGTKLYLNCGDKVQTAFVRASRHSEGADWPVDDSIWRILDDTGRQMHERQFVPDDSFSNVKVVRALRARDGSAFILAPAEKETWPPGRYRLQLRYLSSGEDAVGKAMPTLSWNGNKDLQETCIDFELCEVPGSPYPKALIPPVGAEPSPQGLPKGNN